ncbi:hypothetical protein PUR29_32915 [Methylobacterium ajmalii]|uniref:Lipoprotein n=1 Tax=Methylobacterium ajmalii TaxID=2738439 RepID=A0ABV0A451_9HYPH
MDACNDDFETSEELLGFTWTDRLITDEQMDRIYQRTVCGSESPLSDDHGAWVREYDETGNAAGWRYWLEGPR